MALQTKMIGLPDPRKPVMMDTGVLQLAMLSSSSRNDLAEVCVG